MWSLVSIKQQSPRRPCDILVANVGPEVAKTAKSAKCVRNVQSSKWPKQHFQGLANKVHVKECARVFCVCQSVLPASPGLFRPRGLVQPSPAFSSWFQPGQGPGALPCCPEAQGECLSFRELPREVTGPRSLDSAQECAQVKPRPCAPPAHRNCAQDWKPCVFRQLNILFLLFDLKSCFYIYVTGSQPYWIPTSCQPCLFTNCISCQPYWFYNFTQLWQFNWEMKLKVDLWLDYSYFVFGMGQYTLFPIDFNGKPEILFKTFKKNFFLWVWACVCDWTLIIFHDSFALHYLMSTLFLKKKKKKIVYFNTNNFEIFSCQPFWISIFFCQAMCWHSTLTLIQIGMHVCGMSLHMLGWTLISLIQIYFNSFGFTPIVIYFRILPCELIDSLCMGQVSGQAIAYVPYILSWCCHWVIIHLFNQTWDASNVCISFIFFGYSSNVWIPSRIINDWI